MIDRKRNDSMRDKHMVSCSTYADHLVDYSDGELSADDRAAIEAHLAECGPCRDALRRLDTSLAALRAAVVVAPAMDIPRQRQFVRTAAWIAAGSTAAAILLAVGVIALKGPTSGRGDPDVAAGAGNPGELHDVPPPGTATTGRGYVDAGLTPEDAFRRIALLEQQARLETSLALMPDEPWLADQRAANERLLAAFRQAAAAGSAPDSTHKLKNSKDTL